MPDHTHELELVGRPKHIQGSLLQDSDDALRLEIQRGGVRDRAYHVRRVAPHHFIISAASFALAEHIRDIVIVRYRVMYCGGARTHRQRVAALTG